MPDSPLLLSARQWVVDKYPYNSFHLIRAVEWLDRIAPDSAETVRMATLTHDMERAFPGPDQPVQKSLVDHEYHAAHSARSARIVGEWLREEGADESYTAEVERLIRFHEDGGWPEANLVQAADSLSFLDVNIDLFLSWVKSGKWPASEVRKKFEYSLDRIQVAHAKLLAQPLFDQAIARLELLNRTTVIDQFLGDATTPIEWSGEDEKQLHFWYDDLHCPQPVSPMWFDVGGWWLTCGYMFRRFGVPFAKDWAGKNVGGYVMSAVLPRDPREEAELAPYYNMVMPVYGDRFLHWWKTRYLPEIERNFEFLDTFPMETASLPELMILLEDALDIQERHFRLHWILNMAQFQTTLDFQKVFNELIGEQHASLTGSILTSDEDRNWDSVRELWKLKETIKSNPTLQGAFRSDRADAALKVLAESEAGRNLLHAIDTWKNEFGNKSMYTHEYLSKTWREDPTPIIEALRGYLASDYDYPADVTRLKENRAAATAEMWRLFPADKPQTERDRLRTTLDLALKMVPLTPDHHFYMDQGTYARVRLVFMAIGGKLVAEGVLREPDDVLFLNYHELRVVSANHAAFDAKALAATRQKERTAAMAKRPRFWAGTITNWSFNDEPYKRGNWGWPEVYTREKEAAKLPKTTLRGLGASAGVVEGLARLVQTPEQFDQVKKGEILVCQMTNPAWVVLFTKIGGLITDAGGTLSHPAVVSREFGIPAVVGTGFATQRIATGQRVRVNGAAGIVEILG